MLWLVMASETRRSSALPGLAAQCGHGTNAPNFVFPQLKQTAIVISMPPLESAARA
jgi:hypothetical protein